MASSRKSSKLKLNLWQGSDTPQREDFVYDNQQLESLVGSHIGDTALHLNTVKNSFLLRPFYMWNFAGNGAATRRIVMPFISPRLIYVISNHVPFEQGEDGKTHLYSDFYAYVNGRTVGGGVDLYSGRGGVKPSPTASGYAEFYQGASSTDPNVVYHLNETGVVYTVLYLPAL